MNNYHIYEEIGRGKYSVVYKGRRKKTIEYVAVKSVEKSRRKKVLNEVKILHNLNHKNVLKFYNWYQTRNHLWIIFQYCTGGDVMQMVEQDKKAKFNQPEKTIRYFGRDLVEGLYYLHANGVIYADLKPSNILINEYGVLKLCDFGLSCKLVDLVPSEEEAKRARNGTPCYMAPELFEKKPVHSYYSDLYSLGVVLFELATGKPPFNNNMLKDLIQEILEKEVPRIEGYSDQFNDLIQGLLAKDPVQRLSWPQVLNHPFWQCDFSMRELPQQPQFNQYLQSLGIDPIQFQKQRMNLRTPLPPSILQDQINQEQKHESKASSQVLPVQSSSTAMLGNGVPNLKAAAGHGTVGSNRVTAAVAAAAADRREKQVDIMRLSYNVRKHIDGQDTKYSPVEEQNRDIKLDNRDQELNFGQKGDEDDDEEVDGNNQGKQSNITQGNNATNSTLTGISAVTGTGITIGGEEESFDKINLKAQEKLGGINPFNTQMQKPNKTGERHQHSARPRVIKQQQESKNDESSNIRTPSTVRNQVNNETTPLNQTPSQRIVSKPLDQLLVHNSDSAVKPIIGNKQIEKPLDCKYDPSFFRFKPLSAQEISQKIQQKITQELFSEIYQAVGNSTTINEKLSILAYFQSIITGSSVANNLINSPFLTLIVKTLRNAKTAALKLRLCSILGQLTRHSTVIENQAAEVGICSVLIDLIKVEKNQRVRRKGMAALGEYLFYAATQLDDKEADEVWQIPNSAITLLINLLKPSQDQTVRFYVSKTIQNITAQSQKAGHKFATQEILNQLSGIYSSNTKNDNFKTSAAVAICNVCKLQPELLGSFFDQMAFSHICSGLSDGSPRAQQALVTILNSALYNTKYHEVVCKSLSQQRVFFTSLAKLLEHSNVVIRGKTLLTFLLLFKIDWRWMIVVNQVKFYSLLDRLMKDSFKYIQCCLVAMLQTLTGLVPLIIHRVIQDFSRLVKGSHPKSPPDTALQRYTQDVLNSHKSDYSNLRGQLMYLVIVYDLLNTNSLKHRVFTAELIQALVQFLERFQQPQNSAENDEFRRLVFAILQTLGEFQHNKVLINHHGPILTLLMPSLLKRLKQHNADTRFHSLKIFINIITIYLNEDSIYEVNSTTKATTKQLNQIILKQLLSNYGIILTDQDPVPLYGLKLLHVIIERNPDFIGVLKKLKVLAILSEYFMVGHNRLNMHTIRIVRSISESKDVGIDELLKYDLFEKVKTVLKNMVTNYQQDWCKDALLDILYNLAMRTFETIKHHNQNPQEQQLISEKEMYDITDSLIGNYQVCAKLVSNSDINIIDKAAQTLYLIFQLYHALKQKLSSLINLNQEHINQLQNGLRNEKSHVQRRVLRCLHWAFSNIDDHKISLETRQTITKTVSQLVNSEDKNTASTAKVAYRQFQKYLQQI